MARATLDTLLDRVYERATKDFPPRALVPLVGYAGTGLRDVLAVLTSEEEMSTLVILADEESMDDEGLIASAMESAHWAGVIGEVPISLTGQKHVLELSPAPDVQMDARVLVVYSETLQAAIIEPTSYERDSSSERPTQGFWTTLPALVAEIIELVVDCMEEVPPLLDHIHAEPQPETILYLASRAVASRDSSDVRDTMQRSDLASILDILKAISSESRAHDVLYLFTKQIAARLKVDRCSVVRVNEGDSVGRVLASHDDASLSDVEIALDKYPELGKAVRWGQTVHIEDTASDPLTRPFFDSISSSGINSLLVVPIVTSDPTSGTLLLRAARHHEGFAERDVQFCEILAESAANALERVELVESVQRANEELEQLARTDGLTGLFNHRYFRARLEEEVNRAARYASSLACMFVDVDDFKQINDVHGHLVGDKILREIAERMLGSVRLSDIVGRYGGEEFVAVLPQTDEEGATTQAVRLLETISSKPYAALDKSERVTVSIGVAIFDAERVDNAEALLVEADSALYKAKQGGKNRVVVGSIEHTV